MTCRSCQDREPVTNNRFPMTHLRVPVELAKFWADMSRAPARSACQVRVIIPRAPALSVIPMLRVLLLPGEGFQPWSRTPARAG